MDVINVTHDNSGFARKFARGQALEKPGVDQPAVNVRHSGRNVLTELELISTFEDFDCTKLAGPVVNILEQVAMDGAQVGQVE